MSEWLLVLLLVNTVILILVKHNVKKVDEKGQMLSSRVEYLSQEVRDLVSNLRSGGAKVHERTAQQQSPPAVREPVVIEKSLPATVPDVKPVLPPPMPAFTEVNAAAPAPVSIKKPSAFAESAKDILGKIWRWIIYGDENKHEGMSTEVAVATTWLIRVGVIVVVIGVIYFLKWSLEDFAVEPAVKDYIFQSRNFFVNGKVQIHVPFRCMV